MSMVTLILAVLLWASSTTARRSAATQTVVDQCTSLKEAPMQENDVWLYDGIYHVTKNPFLWKNYPIPFDKMHSSMLVSAACELVQDLHAGLDELESETADTWDKVLQPLELLYDGYERMTSVFELMGMVDQTEEMEMAVGQGNALTRGFSRRLQQSTALYDLLLRVRDHRTSWMRLSFSQLRVLDHWLAKMEKGGVHLSKNAIAMTSLNRLDDEEVELKHRFVNNVRQGTAAFHLTLRNGEAIRGVPRSALAAMATAAQQRSLNYSSGWTWATEPASTTPPLDGAAPTPEWGPWTVTFDPFVYESMMAYCPNRLLRQLLYQSFENRASQAPWDNVPVVERLLQVRRRRALLLGFSSHAELVSSSNSKWMGTSEKVKTFLDAMLAPVASAAMRTLMSMLRLMAANEARGEDVWGDKSKLGTLDAFGASGRGLALGWSRSVSLHKEINNAPPPFSVIRFMRYGGIAPAPVSPRKISLSVVTEGERILNDGAHRYLSQPDCVAFLANATTHFRQWDVAYWAHRLDSNAGSSGKIAEAAEDLSIYFTLNRVLSGAFGLLSRLWGMHVVESVGDKPPTWYSKVRHFRLFNGTELLGSFFFDPYARANKINVPFTHNLVKRSEAHKHLSKKYRAPTVVMSTNIKAPEPGEQALLQINDVLAVFHELGHVVQRLAHCENEVLVAGTTTVPLDFLEIFSQFFELWATEDRTLNLMAQNYKTYALLTADKRRELIQAMGRTRSFKVLDQLYMSRVDLSLHSDYEANATHNVLAHRHQVARGTLVLPYSTNNCDFCTLVGSFGSGHGAGYYSNLWSAVHASDAMGYFEEVGISDDIQVRALGEEMAEELLIGGIQSDANAQYERFRRRPVSAEHFVAHLDV